MKGLSLPPAGLALLAALILGWGTSWPFIKIAVTEIPPWTFRGLIAPFAAAFLFGLALVMKEKLAGPRGQWGVLTVTALLNITGWHVFSALGIRYMGSGHASIIAYTMPLWAVVSSMVFAGERPTVRRLLGLACGMAAMAVLLSGKVGLLAASPLGVAFMFGAAITWGLGTTLQKRVKWGIPPVALAGWQLLIGGLPITIVAMIVELPDLQPVSMKAVLSTLYILVVGIIFCWYAWFKIVGLVPVTVSSVSILLVPVIAVISGNLVLDEPVGARELSALALVSAALALVLIPARKAREAT